MTRQRSEPGQLNRWLERNIDSLIAMGISLGGFPPCPFPRKRKESQGPGAGISGLVPEPCQLSWRERLAWIRLRRRIGRMEDQFGAPSSRGRR
jgi:hypothetical protein